MRTVDFLNLKHDWNEIKDMITVIASQIENDDFRKKEDAVKQLIEVIDYMDRYEPRAANIEENK